MVRNGYLSDEFLIKSPAIEFFGAYLTIAAIPFANDLVQELGVEPSESKRIQYSVGGFQISKWYNSLKEIHIDVSEELAKWQNSDNYTKLEGTMSVIHTEGNVGGRATWTIQYEKIRDDIEDPRFIMDTTKRYFQAIDDYIFQP